MRCDTVGTDTWGFVFALWRGDLILCFRILKLAVSVTTDTVIHHKPEPPTHSQSHGSTRSTARAPYDTKTEHMVNTLSRSERACAISICNLAASFFFFWQGSHFRMFSSLRFHLSSC